MGAFGQFTYRAPQPFFVGNVVEREGRVGRVVIVGSRKAFRIGAIRIRWADDASESWSSVSECKPARLPRRS